MCDSPCDVTELYKTVTKAIFVSVKFMLTLKLQNRYVKM